MQWCSYTQYNWARAHDKICQCPSKGLKISYFNTCKWLHPLYCTGWSAITISSWTWSKSVVNRKTEKKITMVALVIDNHGATVKYVIRGGGTEIWLGGLVWEATKQPIIRAKRPHARVKNWGPLASPVPPPLSIMVSLIAQDHHLFTCWGDFAHKETHKQLTPVTIVLSGWHVLS